MNIITPFGVNEFIICSGLHSLREVACMENIIDLSKYFEVTKIINETFALAVESIGPECEVIDIYAYIH